MSSCQTASSLFGQVPQDLSLTHLHANRMSTCNAIIGNLTVPTGAESGFVLTSNSAGTASWQPPSNPLPPPNPPLFLVPQSGFDVTPDSVGNIEIAGDSGIVTDGTTSNILTIRDVRNLSQFVVGPNSDQAQYQTVSSALTDANATFQAQNILIQAGNYVGEVWPVVLSQTFQGVGEGTVGFFGFTITLTATAVVIFENITFNGSSITVGNGCTVIFKKCVFIGPGNLATNNASIQFYNTICQPGFTVNIGIRTIPFLTTDFPMIFQDSTFDFFTMNGNKITNIDNCTFNNISIISLPTNAPNIPNVIKNSRFSGTVSLSGSTPTIDNPLIVTGCTFEGSTVSLSISGGAAGNYIIDDCIFMGNNTGIPGFTLASGTLQVDYCTFSGVYFATFVAGTTVQFTHCNFSLVNPLEFRGVSINNQSISHCKISQRGSVISNPIIVSANGFLRASYLTVSVENAGVPLFDIQAGSQMVLLYSNLRCANVNYLSVAGTGTLMRPLFGATGSNLLEGPGGIGGATVTDVMAPFGMV